MRILEINKFYRMQGGAEKAFIDNINLFREKGHEVAVFSMKTPDGLRSEYDKYFIENKDFHHKSFIHKVKSSFTSIYSQEAYDKISSLIKDFKPDIAHTHNFMYHLTPSIITALKENNVPIASTLHDLFLVCPNYSLFNNRTNSICEKCKGGKYYNALLNRCMKGSLAISALGALNFYFWSRKAVFDKIDAFIAPSNFMKRKIMEFGYSEEKINVINNFVDFDETDKNPEQNKTGDYIFLGGRLSPEKGIDRLLKAFKVLKTGVKLYIAGSGPIENRLREEASELKDRVKFLGFLNKEEIKKYITGSLFAVVPSICNENFPYAVIEPFVLGKPVLGARIGGIPEIIEDGATGYLYNPSDVEDLKVNMAKMLSQKDKLAEMGSKAKKKITIMCNKETYYNSIISLFNKQLEGKK